jgi:hypothetical protein
MDEASERVSRDEAEQPKHEKYDGDSPEHQRSSSCRLPERVASAFGRPGPHIKLCTPLRGARAK